MTSSLKPVLVGLLMGPLMLWMGHDMLMGQGGAGAVSMALFVGLHILAVLAVLAGAVFAARLSDRWRRRIDRLHRPKLAHLGLMLTSASLSAWLVHILHGGPT